MNKMQFAPKESKFDRLLALIPKYPELWTPGDTSIWLSLIGMDGYLRNFEAMRIDGLLILELTEEDLKTELQISVKLHRKKIIKAIELLKQYDAFLRDLAQTNNQNNNTHKLTTLHDEILDENIITEENYMAYQACSSEKIRANMDVEPAKLHDGEGTDSGRIITVWSIEGSIDMPCKVDSKGARIGRHSSNQIVILDESVSRYHAEIISMDYNFYLRDIGSSTGTYVKVFEPLALKEGMIVEVGSYQFQVGRIVIANTNIEESFVEFGVYDSIDDLTAQSFRLLHNSSIGRKSTNTISLNDDLHMSNLHCKIYLLGDKFLLEDIESTNGTWIRLSHEEIISEPMLLTHGMIFKIGSSAMYKIEEQVNVQHDKPIKKDNNWFDECVSGWNTCIVCWEGEKNCLILPCKHNVTCVKCIKSVRFCPVCRAAIEDVCRIYNR